MNPNGSIWFHLYTVRVKGETMKFKSLQDTVHRNKNPKMRSRSKWVKTNQAHSSIWFHFTSTQLENRRIVILINDNVMLKLPNTLCGVGPTQIVVIRTNVALCQDGGPLVSRYQTVDSRNFQMLHHTVWANSRAVMSVG